MKNAGRYVQDRVAQSMVYVHVAETGETVEGYLLYDIQPGQVQIGATDVEQPPILRVLEFCASTAQARRGLLGYLALQRQVGRIEYVTTPQQLEAMGAARTVLPAGNRRAICADHAYALINASARWISRGC